MNGNGLSRMLTPATTAVSMVPARSALTASCRATSDDEHAVSTTRLGPEKSKQYEMRLAISESALPVI